MRNHLLFSFLLVLFISQIGWTQRLTEFSTTPSEYLKELEDYMTSSKRKVMEEIFLVEHELETIAVLCDIILPATATALCAAINIQ